MILTNKKSKMKKSLFLLAIAGVMSVNSCREEMLQTSQTENKVEIADATVKNGRLYFQNKESLQNYYNNLKDKEDKDIVKYFSGKDIISLRPIVTDENESEILNQTKKRFKELKKNKRFTNSKFASKITTENDIIDSIDDIEEIIGDDAYATFLNNNGEIQVAEDIYKYTDVGLFIVDADEYPALISYLERKDISDDLLYPTSIEVKEQIANEFPSGVITTISISSTNKMIGATQLEYFNYLDDGSGGSSGGGTYTPINSNDSMYTFLDNLQECNERPGVFSGLLDFFGDDYKCIDRYEDRRRVKTKSFNYNYLLVYHVGVKVKNQYKGWTGFWRQEDAEEIRLGVEAIQFDYDFSDKFVYNTNMSPKPTIYNQNKRYMFDSDVYYNPYFNINNYNGTYIEGFSLNEYPKLIQDDIIIFNYISGNGIFAQAYNAAVDAGNKALASEKLNNYFWNDAVPNGVKWLSKYVQLSNDQKGNNITLVNNVVELGKISVQKAHYNSATNKSSLHKTFDFGASIAFSSDLSGNIKFDPSFAANNLTKPSSFRVRMYGIAKRNGVWHGSKMMVN